MSAIVESECLERQDVEDEERRNFARIFRYNTAPLAVIQLQRCFRGVLARKRIRLRRKRRMIAAALLERVGRGYISRLHFVVLHDVTTPSLRRIVIKASNRAKTPIPLAVAAASVIIRFFTAVRSRRECQNRRDERSFIHAMATRIQTRFRKFSVRNKFAHLLLETRRSRHEKLLQQYLKCAVIGKPLNRMAQHNREKAFERLVCQLIIDQHLTFKQSVEVAQRSSPEKTKAATESTVLCREEKYAAYCNHRQIFGLDKELTSDSDDDSIDEELLQPSQKAVTLVKRRRNKNPVRTLPDGDDEKTDLPGRAHQRRSRMTPAKNSQTKLRISRVVDRLMYNY